MNAASSNASDASKNVTEIDPWFVRTKVQDLFPSVDEGQKVEIAGQLAALNIPDLRIITSPGSLALYSRDQADVPDLLRSTLFDTEPNLVVQPFSNEAVQALMTFAASKDINVIVRGAGSSPFGGSMPVMRGIVIDMNAMDRVIRFDAKMKLVRSRQG